jgi:ATP-dependent exoDNAse (exonuclease V) beta subunit
LLDEYNVAGTVDALFKKPNKDEYIIVDWKRSKKLVVDGNPKKYGYGYALSELAELDNSSYYKYALQQNIYKYILENKYGLSISSMNLIVLHENNDDFSRVNLPVMTKEVEVILNSINHKI